MAPSNPVFYLCSLSPAPPLESSFLSLVENQYGRKSKYTGICRDNSGADADEPKPRL